MRPAGLPSARPVDALTAGDRRGAPGDACSSPRPGGPSEAAVLAAGQGEALQLAIDDRLGALPFVPSWSDREKVAVELEVLRPQRERPPARLRARAARRARRRCRSAACTCCPTAAASAWPACSSAPRCPGSAAATARCSSPSKTRPAWPRSSSSTTSTCATAGCSKEAVYLLVEGELQNNDERGLAIVAARIVDLEAVLGRLRDLPPDERNRALKRSGEWLPKVEPRTARGVPGGVRHASCVAPGRPPPRRGAGSWALPPMGAASRCRSSSARRDSPSRAGSRPLGDLVLGQVERLRATVIVRRTWPPPGCAATWSWLT